MSWIQVNGTDYKPGGIVVLKVELNPTFGIIYDILVFDVDQYLLVCEELITVHFNSNLHAFHVSYPDRQSFLICTPSDLADYNVLGLYKQSGSYFVTLKYYLIEEILC